MSQLKNRNQRIDALLATVKAQLNQAQSQDDLIQVIENVKAFDGPLKFDHTHFYLFSGSALFIVLLCAAYYYFSYGYVDTHVGIALILLIISAILVLLYVWHKNNAINKLADRLFQLDVLFDNGLRQIAVNGLHQADWLKQRFHEFSRGNYSQEIRALYEGHYQGAEYSIDYYFYHFHYVDKRTTVTSSRKGGVRTRTVYDHFDRYGIYLPFNFVSRLALISKSVSGLTGCTYKPASNKFNQIYRVIADSEINAARFLTPMVVLACEQIATAFGELNFEFNHEGELCMSFCDSNVIFLPRKNDFGSPDAFILEVQQQHVLPKLKKALDHIHTLMVYSDSNFRK